jgi:hypothetical protein
MRQLCEWCTLDDDEKNLSRIPLRIRDVLYLCYFHNSTERPCLYSWLTEQFRKHNAAQN